MMNRFTRYRHQHNRPQTPNGGRAILWLTLYFINIFFPSSCLHAHAFFQDTENVTPSAAERKPKPACVTKRFGAQFVRRKAERSTARLRLARQHPVRGGWPPSASSGIARQQYGTAVDAGPHRQWVATSRDASVSPTRPLGGRTGTAGQVGAARWRTDGGGIG